jgi:oxygen-independent coproporphyrinogen-3 oxidase
MTSATALPPESFADLVRRYDRPGPRYTSYPTALEFGPSFGPEDYRRALRRAARAREPLAVYVHIPFCRQRCHFCGCHAIATPRGTAVSQPYVERLKCEAELVATELGARRQVTQYHWGGGTPTYLTPGEIADLASHFRALFEIAQGAEGAVEVDPRVTTPAHLDALRAGGFNRLSVGVQDYDAEVQRLIGRTQAREQTETLIGYARALGFSGVNVDLIYGLPGQRLDAFAETAHAVAAVRADRVALYSFAYVPWMKKHQTRLPPLRLPAREDKLALFLAARKVLLEAGYVAIGMDHFARPDDDLARAMDRGTLHRNFMGYTTRRAPDLIGLGVSAIGDVAGAFAQNHKKLSRYEDAIDAEDFATEKGYARSVDDDVRGDVIRALLCAFRLDTNDLSRRHHIKFDQYFAESLRLLEPLMADGLVRREGAIIAVTQEGRFFVRNIAMCFDRHLNEAENRTPRRFSRTV